MSCSLVYGCSWSFRPNRGARACFSQERSFMEPGKRDRTSLIESTQVVTRDNVVVPDAQAELQDSLPPLVRALKASAAENAASFHFPGHNRGRAAPSSLTQLIGIKPFLHDLTELPELDNLLSPEGPILDAQRQAAKLFGASETWFLVGGTTCGIQAAIMATCSPGDTLILPRNSHMSAISAMVLSGAIPKYIIPQHDCDWGIAGCITPLQLERAIRELELDNRKAAAVFVTSPTYHGMCSDLSGISSTCHSYNLPLVVDEAHGAHFGFHPQLPSSALHQGADIAVQSIHKVLCSLTQSAMLHMSGSIVDRERITKCLQALQSTSPSYLLLASLDAARAELSKNPETAFDKAVALAIEARNRISKIKGISVLNFPSISRFPTTDPLRITVGVWQLGLSGFEVDEILYRDYGVVSELTETRSITYVFNLGTCREHVNRLVSGLDHLSTTCLKETHMDERFSDAWTVPLDDISISMSPRDAFFAGKRKVKFEDSIGEICGELICPYPPGIPLMIPGEIISEKALDYLITVKSRGAVITGAADPLLSSIVVCNA